MYITRPTEVRTSPAKLQISWSSPQAILVASQEVTARRSDLKARLFPPFGQPVSG